MKKLLRILIEITVLCGLIVSNVMAVYAATSTDVTITYTPGGLFAPTNFQAVTINDNKITVTWTPNPTAVGTIVRVKVGSYPTSSSDGLMVYNGAGHTVDDTSIDLSETTANIYYRAWSVDGGGNFSPDYAQDNTGSTSMVFLGLVVLLIGGCVVSSRSAWFGYKLGTGFVGFLWWMYITSNPPSGVVEGSGVHVALIWAPLVLALMAVLAGLGRGINQSESKTMNGESVTYSSENFGFHLPKWMRNISSNDMANKRNNQNQNIEDYRRQIHSAYYPIIKDDGRRRR